MMSGDEFYDDDVTSGVRIEKCRACDGDGWTAEHAPSCGGDCWEFGCPVQVQCSACGGSGEVEV
jgi:hypothetical protein